MIHRLLGRGLTHRTYRDENAAFGFCTIRTVAGGLGKEVVILADVHIASGMPFGAALAGNDVAGQHRFAAENLQSKALPGRVTAVTRGSACFLMCHYSAPNLASKLTCALP